MSKRTAELVLQLVDKTSGPANIVAGSLTILDRLLGGLGGGKMGRSTGQIDRLTNALGRLSSAAGRMPGLNLGAGVGGVAGGYSFARALLSFQEARNFAFGRLLDPDGQMTFGDGTRKSRTDAQDWFDAIVSRTDAALPLNADQIATAVAEAAGAGLTPAQIEGALKPAMEFATAARLDPSQAMLDITSVAQMFKLPLGSVEEANATIVALSDKITFGADKSAQSADELYQALKYAGPLASAVGMTVDDLIAQTMVLAGRGIRGSEAGVALRQQLSSLIKPTKQGAATLESYGIDLSEYVKGDLTTEGVLAQLRAVGISADALSEPIAAIVGDSALSVTEKVSAIAQSAVSATNGSAADLAAASDAIFEAYAATGSIDVMGIMAALDAANVKPADWIRIFTLRGGAKTLGLLDEDARTKAADVAANSAGTASRVASEQMRDLPGALDRFTSAFGRLAQAVGDSALMAGIISGLDTATNVFSWLATLPDPILSITAAAGALGAAGGAVGILNALSGVGGVLGATAGLAATAIKLLGPIGLAVTAIQAAGWGIEALNDWRMDGVRKAEETESSPAYLQQRLDEIDADVAELRANPGAQLPMMVDGVTEMLSADQAIGRLLEERVAVAAQLQAAIEASVSAGAPRATADMVDLMTTLQSIGAQGVTIPSTVSPAGIVPATPSVAIDGARAAGGPVHANGTFLVGEKGPELFVPGRSGTVHSSRDSQRLLGQRVATHHQENHFHIHATDPDAIAARIGRTLDGRLQRSRGLSMDGRKEFE